MKKTFFTVAVMILLIGFSACRSKQSATTATDTLVEKRWQLVELFGEPVSYESNTSKTAYLIFKEEGNQVVGNSACNNFHGAYQLGEGNRLSFSQMISTKMLCINNMDIETKLNQVFETTDSYYLKGDTLILNRARMAPLARFEVVYM
jgi:heat shock protein HslJ